MAAKGLPEESTPAGGGGGGSTAAPTTKRAKHPAGSKPVKRSGLRCKSCRAEITQHAYDHGEREHCSRACAIERGVLPDLSGREDEDEDSNQPTYDKPKGACRGPGCDNAVIYPKRYCSEACRDRFHRQRRTLERARAEERRRGVVVSKG